MKVILVLVLLYLANFGTSYFLHKRYVQSLKRVRQFGSVSTARSKGSFRKKGKIVLLAFDKDGIIQYGEKFEGITVFSKFQEIEGIKGMTLDEVEAKFDEFVFKQALDYIRDKFAEDALNFENKGEDENAVERLS